MRKARYDMQQVICRNASHIGYSTKRAKPGYWVAYNNLGDTHIGRVLGRIAETDRQGFDCKGFLAVMVLGIECTHAGVQWVDPSFVTHCYEHAPHDLLTWITDPTNWVSNKGDITRLIAMAQHGTTSNQFIATRNDADKPYNNPARAKAFNGQYILE